MKRISIIVLCCFTLIFLYACSASSSDTSSIEKPYESILFPSDLSFGMSASQVESILDRQIAGDEKDLNSNYGDSSYDSEYLGGFDEIDFGYYCSFCGVSYRFDNPREEEFEDERTLNRITFLVEDTIPYSARTKEKHGDIVALFEDLQLFLEGTYGEPVYSNESTLGLRWVRWNIPEKNLGIELNLLSETKSGEQGSLEVVYLSTNDLVSDWYLS